MATDTEGSLGGVAAYPADHPARRLYDALCARVGRSGGSVTDMTAWTARLLAPTERRVDRIAVATLAYFSRMSRLAPTDGAFAALWNADSSAPAVHPALVFPDSYGKALAFGPTAVMDTGNVAGVAFVGENWAALTWPCTEAALDDLVGAQGGALLECGVCLAESECFSNCSQCQFHVCTKCVDRLDRCPQCRAVGSLGTTRLTPGGWEVVSRPRS